MAKYDPHATSEEVRESTTEADSDTEPLTLEAFLDTVASAEGVGVTLDALVERFGEPKTLAEYITRGVRAGHLTVPDPRVEHRFVSPSLGLENATRTDSVESLAEELRAETVPARSALDPALRATLDAAEEHA